MKNEQDTVWEYILSDERLQNVLEWHRTHE